MWLMWIEKPHARYPRSRIESRTLKTRSTQQWSMARATSVGCKQWHGLSFCPPQEEVTSRFMQFQCGAQPSEETSDDRRHPTCQLSTWTAFWKQEPVTENVASTREGSVLMWSIISSWSIELCSIFILIQFCLLCTYNWCHQSRTNHSYREQWWSKEFDKRMLWLQVRQCFCCRLMFERTEHFQH
jgi:hypothetical protein